MMQDVYWVCTRDVRIRLKEKPNYHASHGDLS